MTALIAFVLVTTGLWIYAVGALFGAEEIDELAIVHRTNGAPTLFVSERVSHLSYAPEIDTVYTTRLAVYDLETGARISRRVIGWMKPDPLTLRPLGPAPGGFWFFDPVGGVQLISAKDGSVMRTQAQLLSADQESRRLRSGDIEDRVAYLPGSRELVVMLKDGSKLRVSTDSNTGIPFSGESAQIDQQSKPGHVTILQTPTGQAQLRHQDGDPATSSRLEFRGRTSNRIYFDAFFVTTNHSDPILLSDPSSTLIMHTSSLERDAPQVISRVQFDSGESLWTTAIGERVQLRLAQATDTILCLALLVPNGDTELLGLDPFEGTLTYRVDLN